MDKKKYTFALKTKRFYGTPHNKPSINQAFFILELYFMSPNQIS